MITPRVLLTPFRAALAGALLATCLLAAALVTAAPALAVTDQEALAKLNALRAAHGIPSLRENPDWTGACELHLRYLAQNNLSGHGQNPALPGSSERGAWAGGRAVLAYGGGWDDAGTPFRTAPIHLAQILAPALAEVGISTWSGRSCITTWPGMSWSSPVDQAFSFPAEGSREFPYSERMSELPFTPLSFIAGLAEGATTGPSLYVFAAGPSLSWTGPSLLSATLTGPEGTVELGWVDRSSPQIGVYLPSGSAIIVPKKPLRPLSPYRAEAVFSNGLVKQFSFATAKEPQRENSVSVYAYSRGGQIQIRWISEATGVTISFSRSGKTLLTLRQAAAIGRKTFPAPKRWKLGSYRVCVASGGAAGVYLPARSCSQMSLR